MSTSRSKLVLRYFLAALLALSAGSCACEQSVDPGGDGGGNENCGNGVVDEGEECDDGDANADTADTCRTDCKNPTCGDGITDSLEDCDDGTANANTADACRQDCTSPRCGDMIVDTGETCDDGNGDLTDSCPDGATGTCQDATCGDGFVQAGVEGCDDGNNDLNDACPDGAGGTCQAAMCGDGLVQTGVEDCDDQDTDDTDACKNDCSAAACGDGVQRTDITDPLDPAFEACDDGNRNDFDSCPDGANGTCRNAGCGDGFVDFSAEQCDDGNTATGDGCDDFCQWETVSCGDGNLDTGNGEQCDFGASNSDSAQDICSGAGCCGACRSNCVCPFCGDFVVDYALGEACDDGNNVDGDGCSASCTVEAAPTCGDGNLDLNNDEQCDPPDVGNGCDVNCRFERLGATCGDSNIDPLEKCDDGNTAGSDSCNATCNLNTTVTTFVNSPSIGFATITTDDNFLFLGDETSRQILQVDIAACDSAGPPCAATVFAGTGAAANCGTATTPPQDNADAAAADLYTAGAMTSDGSTLWFADCGGIIRAIDLTNTPNSLTTVSGIFKAGTTVDGGPGVASYVEIRGLTYYAGFVYLVDGTDAILRRFDPATGNVVTLAGTQGVTSPVTDGYGTSAIFTSPRYIASDGSGNIFIADNQGFQIRSYNINTGYVGTLAGDGTKAYVDGTGTGASLHRPRGLTSDGTSVYWGEQEQYTVRQAVVATGEVSTVAGQPGTNAYTDAVDGSTAAFDLVLGVAYHYPTRSIFVVDTGNNVIRRIE